MKYKYYVVEYEDDTFQPQRVINNKNYSSGCLENTVEIEILSEIDLVWSTKDDGSRWSLKELAIHDLYESLKRDTIVKIHPVEI